VNKCKSCDAPIRWAKTAEGRPHPLDAEPIGSVGYLSDDGERVTFRKGYRSHFATCPQAAQHRKPAPPKAEGA